MTNINAHTTIHPDLILTIGVDYRMLSITKILSNTKEKHSMWHFLETKTVCAMEILIISLII